METFNQNSTPSNEALHSLRQNRLIMQLINATGMPRGEKLKVMLNINNYSTARANAIIERLLTVLKQAGAVVPADVAEQLVAIEAEQAPQSLAA